MNHQQYREWLDLLVYDELEEENRGMLQQHLEQCEACRTELEQRRRLFQLMEDHALSPSDNLLQEARSDLRATIRAERNRRTLAERLQDRLRDWMPVWKPALGYVAALAVGVFAGAVMFSQKTPQIPPGPLARQEGPEQVIPTRGTEISNIRFIDADSTGNGEVEFAFDTVRPMRVKGNVADPKIQQLLTYAMVREQNAGVRLRAVSTLSANHSKPDPKIKEALLTALQSDGNDGVRREALAVLQKYPFDADIQAGVLFVLQNDPNPAMRIDAIKILEAKNIEGQELIQVLRDRMETDNNSFIRQKAKAVLEEVTYQ